MYKYNSSAADCVLHHQCGISVFLSICNFNIDQNGNFLAWDDDLKSVKQFSVHVGKPQSLINMNT